MRENDAVKEVCGHLALGSSDECIPIAMEVPRIPPPGAERCGQCGRFLMGLMPGSVTTPPNGADPKEGT